MNAVREKELHEEMVSHRGQVLGVGPMVIQEKAAPLDEQWAEQVAHGYCQ